MAGSYLSNRARPPKYYNCYSSLLFNACRVPNMIEIYVTNNIKLNDLPRGMTTFKKGTLNFVTKGAGGMIFNEL